MKYNQLLLEAELVKPNSAKFFKKTKLKGKKLDELFHAEHTTVFKELDCLSCANCCKTTSPIFRDIDIKRIAKGLKTSEKKFISDFLHLDQDGDYVLNSSPCYFLDIDSNKCSIYEFRPLACREYPHTDRKNMHQILDLTQKNLDVCPATVQIVANILKKQGL